MRGKKWKEEAGGVLRKQLERGSAGGTMSEASGLLRPSVKTEV